jgi:hypothetical protein
MSSTGYNSNYNDSGWSTPTFATFYGVNQQLNPTVSSNDIYFTTQQTGVYMINGAYQTSTGLFPIQTSTLNLTWIGVPGNVDDAYLVYPGYGFTLCTEANYQGTRSRSYINNQSYPVIFYTGSSYSTSGGTPILDTTGAAYPANSTISIFIYFRGSQLVTPGFT